MYREEEAPQEWWDHYNTDRIHYETELAEYNTLSFWKKLVTTKPRWNLPEPGFYVIHVTQYLDRAYTDEPRNMRLNVPWAQYRYEVQNVPQYSPEWYRERDQAMRDAADARAWADREYASSVWRANAGNAYYDNNNPWAWQRDPGRWG